MSGSEQLWRESAEKIAVVASELDASLEALKEVLRGDGESRTRSLEEILRRMNGQFVTLPGVMAGVMEWKRKEKERMDAEVLKKTWSLQEKEMEMVASLREGEKEKMKTQAEIDLRQEFEEKYREKLHDGLKIFSNWEKQREASLQREHEEKKKELEDQLQKRTTELESQLQKRSEELAAKERRLDRDRNLHENEVRNFGLQREREAGMRIQVLGEQLKVKELEAAELQRRYDDKSSEYEKVVEAYDALVERKNASGEKLGAIIRRLQDEVVKVGGENDELTKQITHLERVVREVSRLCALNLRRDISFGVADGIGEALRDLAEGVRTDVQEVLKEAIDALPSDEEPARKRQRLDDHQFDDLEVPESEAGSFAPFMSGALPVPVPAADDAGQQRPEEDFGDASEEMKEALRRVQFPAGFDTRNFVVALRAAATAGKKSKARIPARWVDRLHYVDASKDTVCLLGKLSQNRSGYKVPSGRREDCLCHRGKEGFCVRLERCEGQEPSEKWWNLIEN